MNERNPWKDAEEILAKVKAWEWTPEVFERCRDNPLVAPCIFNQIRAILSPKEYEQFDMMYCEYIRPGQKEITEYVRKERRRKEWKEKKRALLMQKKKLLLGK